MNERSTSTRPVALARWIGLCTGAEAIGMTSAAAAARIAMKVAGTGMVPTGTRLGLVVAGGLVEGIALATLQYAGLRRWLPRLPRRGWVTATVLVAGLGWALASVPGALADDTVTSGASDQNPPWALMVLGGLALGAVMGTALGAAQAAVLRPHVRHPRQWVAANAAAWAPTMAVMLVGASTPGRSWSDVVVVGFATGVGALAGALLGLVTGLWLPNLVDGNVHNRLLLQILGSRVRQLLPASLVGLRVTGRHNLDAATDLDVLVAGHWEPAHAWVVRPDDTQYRRVLAVHRERRPDVPVPRDAVLVDITLDRPHVDVT